MEHINFDQFKIRKDEESIVDSEVKLSGLDVHGRSVAADSPNCVAKTAKDSGSGQSRFFIKFCTFGMNVGLMYDPGKVSEGDLVRSDSNTGNKRYDFREVPPDAFELYQQFLESGSPAFLLQAQRCV